MIRRIGAYEIAAGLTAQWGERGVAIIGARLTRLIGGHCLHLLCGRFGVYVGYWGPLRPVVEVALRVDAHESDTTQDMRGATDAAQSTRCVYRWRTAPTGFWRALHQGGSPCA